MNAGQQGDFSLQREPLQINGKSYRVHKDVHGIPWIAENPEQGDIGTIYHEGRLKKINQYKTGGLADYTGPAWLDGTKSKPELVLNAQDTKNFIQLKNVLSDLMSDNISDGNGGDNYYEIHIEVDEIANDYDVEKLATKVKKIIANDGMYRNVNTINMLR